MKLNESRVLKLAGLLKENKTVLKEYDSKYFATPEYIKDKLELAIKNSKKKYEKIAKKGYFSYSDIENLFNTFGNGSKVFDDAPAADQRKLRKQFGSQAEQDKKK